MQKTSLGTKIFVSFFLVILLLGIGISVSIQKILKNTLVAKGVDNELVLEILQSFSVAGLGLIMLCMFLIIIISYYLSNKISKPLKNLNQTVQTIIHGDLSKRAAVETNDEIGELADSFNRMMEEVENKSIKLEQAKLKAETILDGIGDGVFVIDDNYKIIVFNKMAENISGYSTEEAIGKRYDRVLKFVYEDSGKESNEFIKECVTKGEVTNIAKNTMIITKNGLKKFVAESASPLRNHFGKMIGCVVVFRDVTLAREVDRMKNEFVSVASHQLRTPLTAVRLFSEMLIENLTGNLDKDQKEYLANIDKSTKRMIRLVNDLLNVARIESGHLKVDPVPTDVAKLIDGVVAEAKPLAKDKEARIVFTLKARLPEVLLDKNLFRQLIHNLIMNAIRYAKQKTGKVEITLDKADKNNFMISIRDNGIGIPEESQKNIFQKFYRADNAVKTETEGTGLGLYLAKMIVDQSGGKIWFESKQDQGTVFYVLMPIKGMKAKEGEKGLAFS